MLEDDICNKIKEIGYLQETAKSLDKTFNEYTYRMRLWFYSVTNRYFGKETDPSNRQEVEDLSKKIKKSFYEKEGVQVTTFYTLNGDWLMSACFWLEKVNETTYQAYSEFTTCYGDKSAPQNMPKISVLKEEKDEL